MRMTVAGEEWAIRSSDVGCQVCTQMGPSSHMKKTTACILQMLPGHRLCITAE